MLAMDYYRHKFLYEMKRFFDAVGRDPRSQKVLYYFEQRPFWPWAQIKRLLSPVFSRVLQFFRSKFFKKFVTYLYTLEEIVFLPYTFLISELEKMGIISKPWIYR